MRLLSLFLCLASAVLLARATATPNPPPPASAPPSFITALRAREIILQIMNPAFGKAEGESAHRRNQDANQQIHRDAAKRRGLLLVDHSVAWNHLLATEGEAAVKKLLPEGVHPNVEGWRRLVTPTLHRALDLAPPP